MEIVGRYGALAALGSALDRAASGRPTLVLVEGPAGMGKTTLIARFLHTYDVHRVARAGGLEAEALIRYGVAGALLRELTGVGPVRPEDDVTEVGGRLLAAVGAGSGPTVLVLDDAQWADAVSLQALTFALRRLESDPVLTIVGTRSLDAGADALPRLVDDPHSPANVGIIGVASAQLRSYERILAGLARHDEALTSVVKDLDFEVNWLNRRKLWYLPYAVHAAIAAVLWLATGLWPLGLVYFLGIMSHPVQGWIVNSFGHAVGSRNFDTPDNSRNNHVAAWLIWSSRTTGGRPTSAGSSPVRWNGWAYSR